MFDIDKDKSPDSYILLKNPIYCLVTNISSNKQTEDNLFLKKWLDWFWKLYNLLEQLKMLLQCMMSSCTEHQSINGSFNFTINFIINVHGFETEGIRQKEKLGQNLELAQQDFCWNCPGTVQKCDETYTTQMGRQYCLLSWCYWNLQKNSVSQTLYEFPKGGVPLSWILTYWIYQKKVWWLPWKKCMCWGKNLSNATRTNPSFPGNTDF